MSVELVSLGECCKFVSGSTVPFGEEYRKQPDGYLILKVSDLNLPENQYTVSDSNEWIANAPKGSMVCSENSIVLPKRGGAISTNKKRLLLRPAILDPNLMGITPQLSKLDPKYLYYWFQQFDLTSITSGSAVPQLNKQDLDPLRIPLPPLTEQKRIASLLRRADRLRQLRRTAHDLSDALLQSVFLEMFGDPETNEKGWDKLPFDDVCTIDAEMVDPREEKYLDLPHIGGANIESVTGNLFDLKSAREDGLISSKFLVHPNNILFSKIRPKLRKVAFPKIHAVCSADIYPLILQRKVAGKQIE